MPRAPKARSWEEEDDERSTTLEDVIDALRGLPLEDLTQIRDAFVEILKEKTDERVPGRKDGARGPLPRV